MSERPADASIVYDWKLVRLKTDAEEGPTMASVRLEEELGRARRVEQEQAEIINALADALADSAPLFSVANGPCWGCHSPVQADDSEHCDACRKRRAALRSAGRLT